MRRARLRPRRLGTPVVLGVALAAFAGLAATSHGFPVQHVSLNDGGIWVTDNAYGYVGRFAKPIAQLDGVLEPPSTSYNVNVWQDGPVVAVYDQTGGRIYAVDVAENVFYDAAGQAITPAAGGIALGDTTLAVLSADHSLRAVTLGADGGSLSALSTAKPLAEHLPADAAIAVGDDGTIWVAGGGELRRFPEGGGTPIVSALPLAPSDPMQVTTVGNVPVVVDPATGTLYLPDSGRPAVTLPGADASSGLELQQSSDASDVVLAATDQKLYRVNLSNGDVATLSSGHSGSAAQPVQVAGCAYAAWADGAAGSYVRSCGTPPPATGAAPAFATHDSSPSLVFRVNNGSVVLNDATDGRVFLVGATINGLEPKWQPTGIPGKSNIQSQVYQAQQKNTLVASPVSQGVRAGTTTVVHVLDDAKGNPDATYVVSAVGKPDQPGVTVAIAPDAQTVLATVTTLSANAHFEYTISDGHDHTASNVVTLVPRSPDQNDPPALRAHYQPPTLKVASGGSLVIPVIGEWRDGDGDPLYIEAGSVGASAGTAAVTGSGALSFTAPTTTADETVTLNYGVSDGRVARPTAASLTISVLGSSSRRFVAPVTEPDAALAVAGAPVTLQPLAIDLPGVDPTNPNASLTLAAPVQEQAGAAISTDLTTGTVTFTAQHAGDFFLPYTAAYGAAPTATGTIHVHVLPANSAPSPPVTTPAVAVLHGQQPAVVDVLANDYDPQGWILGVTGAATADPGVHVAVIDQRWLRVSANDPVPGMTATVDYTVSDGRGSATGTVAVSAVAADPSADQISTTPAEITVQAGASAAVPVLAGDSSSTGLPLSIDGVPPTADPPVAGLLLGIEGGAIRAVAPAGVTTEEETRVSYVVTDADGTTATGSIDVTIVPPPSRAHPDQAPAPQEVDARGAAGDVVVIPIPVDGVDPDGDSVTVTGVTTPPSLGRIVTVGPDSISYQSYPGALGTDTFGYQVTNPDGLTGTAQVRVAVLPPGLPQPPVAVNVVVNAPPGAALHWNVLASDFIAPGDKAVIEPLSKTNATVPAGVRLAGSYVYLTVPSSPSDPPVQFTYGLTDGSTPSLAQVIVHAVPGAKLPPIANDAIAAQPAARATTVTVNVLKGDDDPVGSPGDLRISWVPAGVTVHGPDLTIKLDRYPRQVPYQITASDGLTATAVVYVPGLQLPVIRLKPGARISLRQDGTVAVPLSSVLTDSLGRQLKLTTVSQLTASPAGDLTVSASQATTFQVTALGGYGGPGSVTVQVYDGATLQDPAGNTATVTIPVQVGSTAPMLRCTTDPLQVVEGGAAQAWDIGQLCQLWAGSSVATSQPRYTVTWAKPVAAVGVSAPGGASVQLTAAPAATPGATGTLLVTPVGATVGGTLNVAVIKAPLPVGSPVSVTVKAGQTATVDLSQYVTSPLARPDIEALAVTHPAGLTVSDRGSTVTLTPARDAAGTIDVVASVTDVAGRADREIRVPITVTVIGAGPGRASGAPGAPGPPTATASGQSVVVSFADAAANGAPVEFYTVYANGTPHQCVASPCTITGLASGTNYTVYVTATNSIGQGPRSPTTTVRPNGVPGQVTGLSTTTGDGQVTLTWRPVSDAGSPVKGYQVEISPPPAGQQITSVGLATSKTFTGLTNGTAYTFTVSAVNAAGSGPWSLGVTATPLGSPSTMAAPKAVGAAGGSAIVTVTWTAGQGNGSPVTFYTVDEYQAASGAGPWGNRVGAQTVNGGTLSASFTVTDGSWYEYSVSAANQAGTSAPSPLSAPAVQATAAPGAPTGLTATAQNDAVQVSFTAGAGNGGQIASIEYGINGPAKSGAITGPFTPGTAYTETITNAMSAGIASGSAVTIFLSECNAAGLCSAWAGPSNQVTPLGQPRPPQVTAAAGGIWITFTWAGGGGNGQAVASYHVCFTFSDGGGPGCETTAQPGNQEGKYGYYGTVTGTITAYVVDTSGQQSATVTASATSAPTNPEGPSDVTAAATGQDNTIKLGFTAGASGSAPVTSVEYGINAAKETGTIAGPFTPGSAYTESITNAAIVDGAATTVYVSECNNSGLCSAWAGPSNKVTPGPLGTLAIGPGGTYIGYHATPLYSWVHIVVTNFPANAAVSYSCTSSSGFYQGTAGATYDTDSAGVTIQTDANGDASFDSNYVLGTEGASNVSCTSDGISVSNTVPGPTAPPGGTLTVTEGGLDATCAGNLWSSGSTNCHYFHLVASNFPPNSIVDFGCTDNTSAGPPTSEDDSSGGLVVTDGSGYASFDTPWSAPASGYVSGSIPECTSDDIWAGYGG